MNNVLIEGSSKIFTLQEDGLLMAFKDDIHGGMRIGQIAGTGKYRKIFTYYFYRYMQANGINTHLDNRGEFTLSDGGIYVRMCQPVKIEIIVRNVARGHWCDSHKFPIFEDGKVFKKPIVEFCLKWKHRRTDGSIIEDPRISPELAIALHKSAKDQSICGNMLLNLNEGKKLYKLALDINKLYCKLLIQHGWIRRL